MDTSSVKFRILVPVLCLIWIYPIRILMQTLTFVHIHNKPKRIGNMNLVIQFLNLQNAKLKFAPQKRTTNLWKGNPSQKRKMKFGVDFFEFANVYLWLIPTKWKSNECRFQNAMRQWCNTGYKIARQVWKDVGKPSTSFFVPVFLFFHWL